MLASGMSLRAAARRLKINLNAFQKRVKSARRKMSGGQFSHLMKGPDKAVVKDEGGGGR